MAREYGRTSTQFWNSRDIRALSDQGKLLANYLLTSPHSNMIGAYLLPDAYVSDDLGWPLETVSKVFREVFEIGFAVRFADGRHICIVNFLEWNPVENPNVGKAALKIIDQLPLDDCLSHVFNGLKRYDKHFPNGFGEFGKRFRNMEQEQEPEQEQDQDLARSAVADAVAEYNQLASELSWPKAQNITPKRAASVRKRLAECGGMDGWRSAMGKARASPFLRGETGRANGHEGWTPDLDFFLQQSSFTKLMEGRYDQRGGTGRRQGFDALAAGAARAAGVDGQPGQGMEGEGDAIQRLALPATGKRWIDRQTGSL